MNKDYIYFDNAATTRIKPDEVYQAFSYFVTNIGASPGRGSHPLAIEASRMLYQVRKTVANFFNCPSSSQVIFTKNATEAANLFFRGYLQPGDHVLISMHEHNAIFRPVEQLRRQGKISYSVYPAPYSGAAWDYGEIERLITSRTRILALSLASNLTGEVFFSPDIVSFLKKHGIKLLLDASQGAGRLRPNIAANGIDYLIFTGHKDLYGLPGTGGLCCLKPPEFEPLLQGGTGGDSSTWTNPDATPEKYEAGTANMPALWSLKAGCEYVKLNHAAISEKERVLYRYCYDNLRQIPRVKLYGTPKREANLPILLFNIDGMDCQELATELNQQRICIRSGLHCNILGHTSLGTEKTGAIRVSLDYNNKLEEIDTLLDIINRLAKE
ncbi:MAG TPA: cysteine desulfurase [Clostridiales bacterium]|jgi:cysteine desulfurase family protein|uniref:aminotransferase class V-fold PLP-dependent enzyme n=1 Tax=Syntrophomonas wolfei TaxID=863 RepID=UPI000EDE85FD|nr:aminotransferase class V-fold PLP-dependent enzyme [Syntrophomonas wolfei]HCS73739.1 cysteine desulfurase [Clostridiales bacterium]